MTNGYILLRNKRFLKHGVKVVKFENDDEADDEADHKGTLYNRSRDADKAEERAAQPARKPFTRARV